RDAGLAEQCTHTIFTFLDEARLDLVEQRTRLAPQPFQRRHLLSPSLEISPPARHLPLGRRPRIPAVPLDPHPHLHPPLYPFERGDQFLLGTRQGVPERGFVGIGGAEPQRQRGGAPQRRAHHGVVIAD